MMDRFKLLILFVSYLLVILSRKPSRENKKESVLSQSIERQLDISVVVFVFKSKWTNRKGYLEDTSNSISHDGTLKGSKGSRGQLARRSGGIFSNPFKTDREKMDQLTELLNQYNVHGIPEQMGLLSFKFDSDLDDPESSSSSRLGRDNSISGNSALTSGYNNNNNNNNNSNNNNTNKQTNYDESLYLEDHWRCIVSSWESMPKKLQNQQDAIWELLHTEVFYIKRLKVISDLFLACLCNLQSECLLNDIDTEKMFSNITEVYLANHYFWMNHLLPMLKASRESHQPLNPIIMKDGFLKFEDIFHPYVKYCLEHSNCLQYVKEKHKESELFKAYVVWCETRKDCDRLRLMDLLVKPMQRLTKYSLLLKAILKKTEADDQKVALKQMNDSVERFVCRVDACLRRRHDQERLASIVSRIESYDAFESSNDEIEKVLKEFTRLNLTCPMPGCLNHRIRQLLLEGSGLKLRDSYASSKLDVHCFLFTDVLLICKSVGRKGDKVKVIRQPFLVDRIVTHELKDGSGFIVIYLNEFNVASAFFTLYTTETRTWVEHIKRSQDHYREAKQQSALYTANQSSLLYRSTVDGEDEDSDFPSTALLVTNTSPRSSRSSLMRSQSGSMDISDSTLALGSNSMIVPSTTPNLLSQNFGPDGEPLPSRAISFELGELRNPSMTVDDLEPFGRSHSMETRPPPISVTITSPRPERRAFLLRGAGSERSYDSVYGSGINTLSVNVPSLHVNNKQFTGPSRVSETSIQVPVLSKQSQFQQQHQTPSIKPSTSPPSSSTTNSSSTAPRQRSVSPRSLQRSLPISSSGYPAANKPPLVKMKNITGLKVHSAPPSEGPSPVHSFDSEAGIVEGCCPGSSSCALVGVDTVDSYGVPLVTAPGTTISTTTSSSGGYNTSIISIGESNSFDSGGYHRHHSSIHSPGEGSTTTMMIINDPSGESGGLIGDDDLDTVKSRLHQKRSVRGERRYHTADSIENIKKEKDSSIHKRLSWNFGQQSSRGSGGSHGGCSNSGSACGSGQSGGHDRVLCNKHFNKCLSSESVYTSSGFSSTGSVPLSVNSCECEHFGSEVLSHIQEMEPSLESQPSPTISPYDEHHHHHHHQHSQHSTDHHHHHSHHHPQQQQQQSHHHPQANQSITINERKDLIEKRESLSSSSPHKIIITPDPSNNQIGTDGESSKSVNPVIGPSDIKIDVSEVKDGISSVQITLSGTNIGKPSKSDLKKMKEFLLTSLEASQQQHK
ncbi:pleckstrin homology domain-containing family G member 5-like isoform X11 [Panonychus citri]|uniref:pleckstrin homology domain-containing family G member 5-like isoform X11 n=1 Tax=Panonychus citri TaxID=50023 RepID=UPI00230702BE|nr:pleckstrin homology domain-containing family G member 5-like isoform X11 [Panonychus citri]